MASPTGLAMIEELTVAKFKLERRVRELEIALLGVDKQRDAVAKLIGYCELLIDHTDLTGEESENLAEYLNDTCVVFSMSLPLPSVVEAA